MEAGTTKTLTIDLAPGHYTFVCNLPGHYGQGDAHGLHRHLAARSAADTAKGSAKRGQRCIPAWS